MDGIAKAQEGPELLIMRGQRIRFCRVTLAASRYADLFPTAYFREQVAILVACHGGRISL
jgi:hypothetical protein